MLADNYNKSVPNGEGGVPPTVSLNTHPHSAEPKATQYAGASGGAAGMLRGVFETLDNAGVRYCVSHGYETYPQHVQSDVDGIIDARVTPRQFYQLLY